METKRPGTRDQATGHKAPRSLRPILCAFCAFLRLIRINTHWTRDSLAHGFVASCFINLNSIPKPGIQEPILLRSVFNRRSRRKQRQVRRPTTRDQTIGPKTSAISAVNPPAPFAPFCGQRLAVGRAGRPSLPMILLRELCVLRVKKPIEHRVHGKRRG
jgi:hypothetical protein